ncbi:hypothetical protein [Mucilaginibacter boryungensis]|uniref:Prepilin-type N-terminal cleavage/methylation domain-containing protein n=1 Tax=Mucilaginibacter boryungensis TaxID=768480 RepID=A0ABR9XMI4_9SPHI|nr:hypothetical protein [Mucilaginibacter boryungensis]MBE9668269.1 hypothetical protein [Mucilaginibacter boryungensis]
MAPLNKKVQASSVLEVIISMLVIIIIFGIAMMIFSNVTNSSLSIKKSKAEALIKQQMLLLARSQHLADETLRADEFKLDVKVSAYSENKKLNEVSITAFDGNQQQVAVYKQIMINKDE